MVTDRDELVSGASVGMVLGARDAVAGEAGRLRAMHPDAPVSRVLSGAELGGGFGRESRRSSAIATTPPG